MCIRDRSHTAQRIQHRDSPAQSRMLHLHQREKSWCLAHLFHTQRRKKHHRGHQDYYRPHRGMGQPHQDSPLGSQQRNHYRTQQFPGKSGLGQTMPQLYHTIRRHQLSTRAERNTPVGHVQEVQAYLFLGNRRHYRRSQGRGADEIRHQLRRTWLPSKRRKLSQKQGKSQEKQLFI